MIPVTSAPSSPITPASLMNHREALSTQAGISLPRFKISVLVIIRQGPSSRQKRPIIITVHSSRVGVRAPVETQAQVASIASPTRRLAHETP